MASSTDQTRPAGGRSVVSASHGQCAVCRGVVHVAAFHMTRRVVVQLCEVHRSVEYLGRNEGWDFTQELEAAWRSHGVASTGRMAALAAHRRTYGPRTDRVDFPGSYSWPLLRLEAEHRFRANEPPGAVIADLRERHGGSDARVPSVQTMRRWFREARWLDTPHRGQTRPARATPRSVGSDVATGKPEDGRRAAGWYTRTGKPPHPLLHIVPLAIRLDVFPPFDAQRYDMSRSGPADDDFGDRWIHGP